MKRFLGIVAMVLGVIGIILSVAVIIGVWVGQGAINDQIASLTGVVDSSVQQAEVRLEELDSNLNDVAVRAREVSTQTAALGQTSDLDSRVVSGLVGVLDRTVGAAYVRARESYVALRERVTTAMDTLMRLDRLIPAIELPEQTGENLQAIDNQLRDWDSALVEFRTNLSTLEPEMTTVVEWISGATAKIGDAIDRASTAVQNMQGKLNDIRTSVAQGQSTIAGWVTTGAVILTLFFLYFLIGNVALFTVGRMWRAQPAVATPVPTAATPVSVTTPLSSATPVPVPVSVTAEDEGLGVADDQATGVTVAEDTVEGVEATGDVVAEDVVEGETVVGEAETKIEGEAGLTRPI